jgi:hypothetical protein
MTLSKSCTGMLVGITASLMMFSCQKETSFNKTNSPVLNNGPDSDLRVSGAVADDPAMLAKVPLIVSSGFLELNKNNLNAPVNAKGSKPDNTSPTVSISSPATGATVSGTISVKAIASDNVGVSLVSLSVDAVLVSSSRISPYILPWNSASLPNGIHTLTVTAKDAAGNTKSVSIQVTGSNVSVGDITNPTISISAPASGASLSGTVNVTVNAADNIGVVSVKYTVDGMLAGSSGIAPFGFSWNTALVSSGLHTLTATASDAAGNLGSSSIQVTVNTVVITPPVLPTSFQLMMPPVGYQGGEGSCVAFATAYAARSVEKYYTSNATSYSYFTNIFSPEFLYNQTKFGDCGSGTSSTVALDFLKNVGVCTWQSMPYDYLNGCSLLPNSMQNSEAASNRISSYSWLYGSDQSAIKTMLTNKHVIIIGITPDQSFYNATAGFIWSSFSGLPGAGHTLVICGYDDAKHAYKVMNSWGTTWAESGFSWIDYDFLPYAGAGVCYVITG